MKQTLRPIRHRGNYTRAVEIVVMAYFDEVIFDPLLDMLDDAGTPGVRENAEPGAVAKALKSGRLWYADGEFSGAFNAEISKELREMGATLNKTRATFTIAPDKLPADIRGAAEVSVDRSRALHQELQERLAQMQANALGLSVGLDLTAAVDGIVQDLQAQLSTTVKGIDAVEVSAEITPGIAQALDEKLTTNLDLYIQDFAQQEIQTLRAEVQKNAFAGYRSDRLVDIIRGAHGVTRRKAAFLADQETSLLVSKYREERYRELGARSYVWATSHDERVRHDHKALDGQTFDWDSPPITNRATGDRNNPGEDFRCRCVAMPVIETPE